MTENTQRNTLKKRNELQEIYLCIPFAGCFFALFAVGYSKTL